MLNKNKTKNSNNCTIWHLTMQSSMNLLNQKISKHFQTTYSGTDKNENVCQRW